MKPYLYGGGTVVLVDMFGLVLLEPVEGAAPMSRGEVEVGVRAGQGAQELLRASPILKHARKRER